MRPLFRSIVPLLVVAVVIACSPPPRTGTESPPAADAQGQAQAAPTTPGRTLVIAGRYEPEALIVNALHDAIQGSDNTPRMFNAFLALVDYKSVPHPYLAESLPQLNTDTWRVFPDGRMETTWKLKPNLTWHDGNPFTADDVVFTWRALTTPTLGVQGQPPHSLMEEVVATDPRTVVIRWKQLYPEAGILRNENFPPLPKHIMEAALQQDSRESFLGSSFWGHDYVGTGPYKLDRWERGAFIEATAFAGHALGKPKIERMRVAFVTDPNAALAAMLSGDAHVTLHDSALRFDQAKILKQQWGPTNAGRVLIIPEGVRYMMVQFRPELVNPRALLDLRVRQAVIHAVDRKGLIDALFDGELIPADTFALTSASYFPSVEREVTKYAYDPRRAQQLMEEAGYRRGADGFYASPTEGTLNFETMSTAGNESENSTLAAMWKTSGLNFSERILPPAQARDNEARAKYPAIQVGGFGARFINMVSFTSALTPSESNRWGGQNRGGWLNADYERASATWHITLDANERLQHVATMLKILSEELPVATIYYTPVVTTHVAALKNVDLSGDADATDVGDIHLWEFN
jgi:peptide/nickel transport system substrate-binding protein